MKFAIRSAVYEDVFEHYPEIVEKFKTEKEHIKVPMVDGWGRHYIRNDINFYIKISTLEDLLKLRDIIKEELIIGTGETYGAKYSILIYDGYIE